MRDKAPDTEKSHVAANFINAGKALRGEDTADGFYGMVFQDNDYRQSEKPVREQSEATGHAVRAVYLYTGMADLAAQTNDKELLEACRRLWDNIMQKKMYITGGIGSTVMGEALTVDYDLPPDTAYSETCAAIGLIFFAGRMLENEASGKYGDVMELAFYNTVLAGMQPDGKRLFYVNPLETDPDFLGGMIRLTVKAQRISDCEKLYSSEPERAEPFEATAVPYYTWGNRGENEMRVWMNICK